MAAIIIHITPRVACHTCRHVFVKKERSVPISRVLSPAVFTPQGVCHLSTLQITSQLKHSTLHRYKNRTDSPQTMVYTNLQPPDGTARRSPAGRWSLTPPSHPYPYNVQAVVFFCLLLPSPTASIFRSGASCAARPFLPPI